ncbi:MAG TPA: aromatic amino acid DMT transporter YddG [Planctomycetota bacterium]|nr:aromatic amino acid DMT transporter YddG [Planctomycetota bacterium]
MTARSGTAPATVLGVVALVLWGSSVALQRSLGEQLGPVGAAGAVYLVSGLASAIWLALRRDDRRAILRMPRQYLLVCGGLFVLYVPCYYLAVGWASGRQQAVEAGVINYLWTAATVAFSVPLLGKRARWPLLPGLILALTGVVLVTLPMEWRLDELRANLRANCWPYLLALAAALEWGLYSNLTRRWAPPGAPSAVPLFLTVSGLAMGGMWLAFPRPVSDLPARALGEIAFMGVAVTFLGYVLWDVAMRRGNLVLVASLSYLAPLLSAVIAVLYLGIRPGPGLWAGCGLIVVGAWLCRRGVVDRDAELVHSDSETQRTA